MSTSEKKSKSWKDALLSTGLPLEHSVREALRALGWSDPYEFKYERKSETGIPKHFSIDIAAEQEFANHCCLHALIECKYRHEGTRWVFCPDEIGVGCLATRNLFPVVRTPALTPALNKELQAQLFQRYPLCSKGTEILPAQENEKSILQTTQQMRFAVMPKAARCSLKHDFAIHQTEAQFRLPDILVPIIVTTAALWRLKPGITIEDIRKADQLEAVADPTKTLWIHEEIDDELMDHHAAALKHAFLRHTNQNSQWAANFSVMNPWITLVVHYAEFRSVLHELSTVCAMPTLLEPPTRS